PYFVPGLDLPHFRIILGLENAPPIRAFRSESWKKAGTNLANLEPAHLLRLADTGIYYTRRTTSPS
ncbi:MAG: hypothetical protein O2968_12650, partial [Acidobacteria bacterium]|nr:hypothetical protein [Acidobacteriota bacterium]